MGHVEYRTAGVIGGMGPAATVDFIAKVIALTEADRDQDHVPLLVDHNPGVPNRQDAFLHGGADPSEIIGAMGSRLEAAGADFLVMPCNSAHSFLENLEHRTSIPFISIIEASVDQCAGSGSAGLLATSSCLASEIYQEGMQARDIEPIVPTAGQVQDLMRLITAIKGGDCGLAVREGMKHIADELQRRGAEVIVAGCTEIPFALEADSLEIPVVSSTEALARETVLACGGKLKSGSSTTGGNST